MRKLNSIINIDLHIHSKASDYKEEKGLVEESNIDNIDILLEKLNDNNINMFSITDHNRFDYDLYSAIRNKINEGTTKYKNVFEILPGIEFDVKFEEDKEICHVICIFSNTDKDVENLKNINNVLNRYGLITEKKGYYSKEKLENVLKDIGLSVVLIAHQHKDIENPSGGKRSISNSVSNVYEYIGSGYINALEYQKPSVQGMLIDNLKKADMNIATIIGTDCHDWKAYPRHDEKSKAHEYITKIKALPTFKGLVFSITSPETRFNRYNNKNNNYIKEISINNEKIELSNGINAIIGDNGSGKSLLMDILSNKRQLPIHYKVLKAKNKIDVIYEGDKNIEYIAQGKIIKDVKNGTLFKENNETYYNKITSKEKFKSNINNYKDKLVGYVNKNIELKNKISNLDNVIYILKEKEVDLYRPKIIIDIELKDDNVFQERENELERIIYELKEEYNNNKKFYKEYKLDYINSIKSLEKIMKNIKTKNELIRKNNKIKSYIIAATQDFNDEMNKLRTDEEKEKIELIDLKKQFVSEITSCILEQAKERKKPVFPKPIKGTSKKLYNGFVFTKQARFHLLDLKEQFFEEMFTSGYDLEKVLKIDTKDEWEKALNGISKLDDFENWNRKVDKFIEKYNSEETYIEDVSSKESVGNTPRRSFNCLL